MDTEASRKLVLDYYQALQSDPAALERILAEDVVWCPPRSVLPEAPFRGRARVLTAMQEIGARSFDMASLEVTTHKLVADGDTVVVLQSVAGRAANGRDYSNEYVWVFTCANGRIARMDEHTDSLRFHRIVREA